jgi:microsomal dipeptidase-like Zn-dependent dipeptidase
MTTDEINKTFDALSEILRESGLAWLQEAVADDITDGALEIIRESDLNNNFRGTRQNARSAEEFLRAREYTPEEKLLTLIEAIEETVVHASDMEVTLGGDFAKQSNLQGIEFVNDIDSTSIVLNLREASTRHEAATKLKQLLAELRSEVQV